MTDTTAKETLGLQAGSVKTIGRALRFSRVE